MNTSAFEPISSALQQGSRAWISGWEYLSKEICSWQHPNYLWSFVCLSVIIGILEILMPWRIYQKKLFKGRLLDIAYLIFNFSLAPALFLSFIFHSSWHLFRPILPEDLIQIHHWPYAFQVLFMFCLQDFIQYWIHRSLHTWPFLWRFHRVHHSVENMNFAAHFRFHWMEHIVYRSMGTIILCAWATSPLDMYPVFILTIAIGHLNHSNLSWTYGPLKTIINNPSVHLWHHAQQKLPHRPYGQNFGISLSVWDLIFKTGHWAPPEAHLKLGFDNIENFPQNFAQQNLNVGGPKFQKPKVSELKR